MPAELRVAVAGVGFVGSAHARSARLAGARLVGVAASSPARAKEAAARLGADRGFPSAIALVQADDVDVVHLCVPNDLHVPLAAAALEAGKHLVCEKPLATDVASADGLLAALAAAGTVGAVPFVYRFHPMVRELRARLAGGDIGRVHLVHGTYLQDWLSGADDTDWRVDASSGGPSRAFADVGSHWFDLVEFVTGDRVHRISARFATVFDERPSPNGHPDDLAVGTEDIALVHFETERGALGSVVISQVSPGRKNALVVEISGTGATARFEQEQPANLWMGRRHETTVVNAEPQFLAPDAARHVVVPAGHPQGYLDCIDRFVVDVYAAVAGDDPVGLPTFADGHRAVVLADAALRSARAGGGWLDVPS